MTALEYGFLAMIIGVPVGFLVGIVFVFLGLRDKTLKEGLILWVITTGVVPGVFFIILFVIMAWFSLFIDTLKLW